MANLNRVILAGNLTRDPQLSYTPNNTPVCKFGMAVNRRWTDRTTGEKREDTCFVDLTAFARSAETINQYMRKGRGILVEGRLQFSQWTNPEGQKRSKLEVVVENFQFLGGPRDAESPTPGTSAVGAEPPPAGPGADDVPPPPGNENVPF